MVVIDRQLLARTFAAGALAGAVFLGAGTRVAMRGVALVEDRAPVWTFGGTLTVIGMGAGFGLLFTLVWMLVGGWIPGNRFARGLLFGALCALIASPGLTPPRLSTFVLFVPWFLVYGVALSLLASPSHRAPRSSSPSRPGSAAER